MVFAFRWQNTYLTFPDDAIPARPLSFRCFPNNKHCTKCSPLAYTVITYSERTHATSPHSLVFVPPPFSPINFHRHHSVMPELFSLLAATFSSCQVAWRFPCHRLAGWSCCGSCLPLRDVHLEWGADRPDSPSPQGLCHVIQASLQALSSTPLFPYTNEGMGLAFIFRPICMQLQKQRSPTPPPHS